MGISIYEALQLPVMSQTKMVAGLDGMNNMIKWVTIVEVIEDIDRLQEGEFLITTGFGLMESEEKRKQFLLLLADKKLSGVALYTGFYISEIPQSFIDVANASALPLIEIPTNINFSMITKAILEQIVNKQFRMFEHSINIHKEFTQLVLGNQGIQAITKTLSRLIGGSVILFNPNRLLLSDHLIHEDIKITDNDTLFIHSERIHLPSAHETIQSVSTNNPFALSLYPVIANHINYGWIVTVKEKHTWQEIDQIAIEHAATVYAIEFLRHKAIEDTENRLQGDFLDQIIHTNFTNPAEMMERGKKLGFDLTMNPAILQIKIENMPPHFERAALNEMLEQLYQLVRQMMKNKNCPFFLRNRLDGCMVLMETNESAQFSSKECALAVLRQIEEAWKPIYPKFPLRIGIGRSYNDLSRLPKSAQEANYALTFSKLLYKPTTVTHYDDLGLYHFLIQMQDLGMNFREYSETHLGALIHNKRQSADMILTLEAYLHNNQNIHHTASDLYIHRHTLKYRLNQIEKKTGYNLQSPEHRFHLLLAIMAYKLIAEQ
ncbi:PucR family transcriptional regulator [Paenibacillus sp. GCM10027628]|uniref:PucR family transcriptional regulator n=1 Tax=Paenibacillus sp. GCM10027628 TaxID=3273413 RepID=UPI003632E6AB